MSQRDADFAVNGTMMAGMAAAHGLASRSPATTWESGLADVKASAGEVRQGNVMDGLV